MHGSYLIFGKICYNYLKLIPNLIKIFITFNLVSFSWIFFRANSLTDAIYIISHMFSNLNLNLIDLYINLGSNKFLLIGIVFIFMMESIHFIIENKNKYNFKYLNNIYVDMFNYISLFFIILLFGVFNVSEFIYFQF